MKLHDVVAWPRRWLTPSGTEDHNASVLDGMLLDIRLWEGTSKITLVVQRTDGKYYGSIRTTRDVYPYLLEFLEKNKGRKLEDVLQAEITVAGWIH
jgi:hypothetical protein